MALKFLMVLEGVILFDSNPMVSSNWMSVKFGCMPINGVVVSEGVGLIIGCSIQIIGFFFYFSNKNKK